MQYLLRTFQAHLTISCTVATTASPSITCHSWWLMSGSGWSTGSQPFPMFLDHCCSQGGWWGGGTGCKLKFHQLAAKCSLLVISEPSFVRSRLDSVSELLLCLCLVPLATSLHKDEGTAWSLPEVLGYYLLACGGATATMVLGLVQSKD